MNEKERCFQAILNKKAFYLPIFENGKFITWPHEYKVEKSENGQAINISIVPLKYDFKATIGDTP